MSKTGADFEHYNPRCQCGGTVKAGTEVMHVKRGAWSAWVVKHHKDVQHFMHKTDFRHSFVDVPTDVPIIE